MNLPGWAHKVLVVVGVLAVILALVYAFAMFMLIMAFNSGGGL
jgi:hypothetical protein